MMITHNPLDASPVPGPLSWGVEVRMPQRILYISGLVGEDVDGRVGAGLLEQARLVWANLGAVLRSAGMSPANVLRTGIYVTREVDMTDALRSGFNELRTGFFGDHRPASTMICVHALMKPAWLVEIDAVAVEI